MAKVNVADQILQNQDKAAMLRRSLEKIIQLYTDKSHFIYELLQNAEDAGATKISFIQYEDRLEVQHDGNPFTMENLQGLCDIGLSDKIGDLNQIGEFGVGFKSVFSICEKVRLYSHPDTKNLNNGYKQFAVEIRDFTNPYDIEDVTMDPEYTTKYVFPFAVDLPFSGYKDMYTLKKEVSSRLQDLGVTTLLFMKNLQSIDYKIELSNLKTSGYYKLNKDVINDHCSFVSAIEKVINENGRDVTKKGKESNKEENKLKERSFLIFSRLYLKTKINKTIDIAFEMTKKSKKSEEYIFIPSESSYISVYFPTRTLSNLKFIVQGPFRTTPNRESVPSDDPDNIYLARQTATLVCDSVLELRQMDRPDYKLNYDLLNLLPLNGEVFNEEPLFKCVYDKIYNVMTKEKIFLCQDGSYASKNVVKIARNAELINIFPDELLSELLNNGEKYYWLPTLFTETNKTYRELYDYLIDKLDIEVIRPENLGKEYNKNNEFLQSRDNEWLIRLYKLYNTIPNVFSREHNGVMLTSRFIKTSKGTFEAPYREKESKKRYWWDEETTLDYLPNLFLPSKDMEDIEGMNYVDENIYQNCQEFFEGTLHLQRPNSYEIFTREFKQRYESDEDISDKQRIKDLKKLLRFKKNDQYEDEIIELVKKYVEVRCIQDDEVIYVNPDKSYVFFEVDSDGLNIEQYYRNVKNVYYVDEDFYEFNSIDREDLKSLGVEDTVILYDNITEGEYENYNPGRNPHWNTVGKFRYKLTLDRLDEVLGFITKNPHLDNSKEKSKFLFCFLKIHEESLTGTLYISGHNKNKENAHSAIIDTLNTEYWYWDYTDKDGKWLYTKTGKLVTAKEITKEELDPRLYGAPEENSKLYKILGFKESKTEKLADIKTKIDQLEDAEKDLILQAIFPNINNISVKGLQQLYSESYGDSKVHSDQYYEDWDEDEIAFPSAEIRHWDTLRKHVAAEFAYAAPVEYQKKIRSVRVSHQKSDVDAYLKGMYKIEGSYRYACQMCHEYFPNIQQTQLLKEMEEELDPMYLCLCPNCAAEYNRMKNNQTEMKEFLDNIRELSDEDIDSENPVEIEFSSENIWFTQTHIAEIRELMMLIDEMKKDKKIIENQAKNRTSTSILSKNNKQSKERQTTIIQNRNDLNVGADVIHSKYGEGTVSQIEGDRVTILFKSGQWANKTVKFSVNTILQQGVLSMIK